MPATSTPATSSGSRPTRSSARAAQTSEDGVRDNTEAQGSIEKGKKRASTAASAEVRVTRRRASGVNEAASSASTPVPVKAEESSARSKKNRGRASGVTRFWRNNSSIAGRSALAPSKKKDFMQSGMYCQDPDPNSPRKLVNRVLSRRDAELAAARKKGRAAVAAAKAAGNERLVFPPMPYDYGEQHFFEQEHEFVLPYDIQWAAENGTLDAKKRPVAYQKIRQNAFTERTKVGSDVTAVCRCTQESGCDENCDNRIMHYTCGKDCPAGENCSNKSLWKRKQPAVKIVNTGQRGFGLFAAEDIKEGDFVIDYRGEVIALDTFYDRCRKEYAKSKNYYALAYDQDEVIDAAVRGNEARFINHGCQPNLEVRKVSTLGEGLEEFEVGMWASKDIAAGEELCYDYNFDSFAAADATECKCGAPNCVGYLGRKPGEKSAKEKALEAELSATNKKQVKKQAKMAVKSAMKKASVKGKKVAVSVKKGKTKASEATKERDKRVKMRQLRVLKAQRAAEAAAEASQGGQTPSNARASMPPPSGTSFDIDPSITQSAPGPSRRGKKSEDPLTPAPRKTKIPKSALGEEDSPLSEPDEAARKKEEARKRRISGWADWLKKKASEKSRTREEWQDFANKRRRGKAWMESMMQEYGVAAYEGGPAEPYTSPLSDIPATGQPKKRGPPPGTPRAPRQPKPKPADPVDPAPETTVDETDAERALRSIYPEFEAENHGEPSNSIPDFDQSVVDLANSVALDADVFDPAAVDFDVAAEQLFGANSVDYFETQQRYGLTQDDTAGGEQPFTLAQVQSGVVDDQAEQLRQRANAIVSSIQPQLP